MITDLWVLVVSPVERRERRWVREEEERGRERVGREEGWEGPARREERSGEWRASRVLGEEEEEGGGGGGERREGYKRGGLSVPPHL